MTDGDQAILNMLMQINNTLVALKMKLEEGINVQTQESHS